LDQAKEKTKEVAADTKKEIESMANETQSKTKETRKDWSSRLSQAADEFTAGVKSAWRKLKGE
ncbi:MAG TPA: hypothetical protein PKC28_06260, partial [Bdellovibrionales bacterium]|nr:hypothetical protein [Bdellovibrionales bacterium]